MSIASLIGGLSRWVPEGELKGTARLCYYLLTGKINRHQVTGERLPFTLRYRPLSRLYSLRFDRGPCAGRALLFPPFYDPVRHPKEITAPWAFLWFAGLEVPSYFAGPPLCPGDLVIDAGACPGDYAILAADRVGPSGIVIALEADRYSAAYLERVLRLNHAETRVVASGAALAASAEPVAMFPGEAPVPAVTFDGLVERHDPQGRRRHVLKMDIEGQETEIVPAVLAGRHRPDLWVIAAYHADPEGGRPTYERLMPMLAAAGYTCQVGAHAHTVLYAWHG